MTKKEPHLLWLLFHLESDYAVLHPDPNIRARLAGSEVVSVSRLDSEAPTPSVFDDPFDGGIDRLVDRTRVELQPFERDAVAGDIERVERVAELVLPDGDRHKDRVVLVSIYYQRIRSLFNDPHRDGLFDHHRIHPHHRNRVRLHHFLNDNGRGGAVSEKQKRAPSDAE